MDSIIYDVQSLFEVALGQLGDRVQMVLSEAGVSSELQRSVEAEFSTTTNCNRFYLMLRLTNRRVACPSSHAEVSYPLWHNLSCDGHTIVHIYMCYMYTRIGLLLLYLGLVH